MQHAQSCWGRNWATFCIEKEASAAIDHNVQPWCNIDLMCCGRCMDLKKIRGHHIMINEAMQHPTAAAITNCHRRDCDQVCRQGIAYKHTHD